MDAAAAEEEKNTKRAEWHWSVSRIMSVFLPERVEVGNQIDAYWSILSLCVHMNFLYDSG